MELSSNVENSTDDDSVVYDENNNKYILPIYDKDEEFIKKNENHNPYAISPCILSYFTIQLINNHIIEKGLKDHNQIKVFNFYLKKKYKFIESQELHKKSKLQYLFNYIFHLAKKYVVKDLRKILCYNLGIFFAEKLARMVYKLLKLKRMLKKK